LKGILIGILLGFLIIGLVVFLLVRPSAETPKVPQLSGKIISVDCPSSVEGKRTFTISINVQNIGDIGADFNVELTSEYLEIITRPTMKYLAPGEWKIFDFNARPFYTGQPEVSTTLRIKAYAEGKEVDSRSVSLMIFMPQLKFTGYSVKTDRELFGRWWILKLNLEIKNQGRASSTGIMVNATLLEGASIRDSDSISMGYLAPGSSFMTTLTLDVDTGKTYRIKIETEDSEGSSDSMTSQEFTFWPEIPWEKILPLLLYLF
jgi:hypothetical protein